jgi:hypothetical protein
MTNETDGKGKEEKTEANSSLAMLQEEDAATVDAGMNSAHSDQKREFVLPPPSKRLIRWAQWWRLGLSLFLILSVLLGTMGCSIQASTPWQSATAVLPKETLLQIVKQQSSNVPNPEAVVTQTMRAWVMKAKQGKVAVFDFNNPGWCGTGGCYYPVYWLKPNNEPPQQLMASLFYNRLPKGKSLFQRGKETGSPVPCLEVWQPEGSSSSRLRLTEYCYNGSSYQPSSSQVFDSQQASK